MLRKDHREATAWVDSLRIVVPMATGPKKSQFKPSLDGENIETEHWEDALHWMERPIARFRRTYALPAAMSSSDRTTKRHRLGD